MTRRDSWSGEGRPAEEGCARGGAGAQRAVAPLAVATSDPVVCRGCGAAFGRGADAGTVCPYCGGSLAAVASGGGGAS